MCLCFQPNLHTWTSLRSWSNGTKFWQRCFRPMAASTRLQVLIGRDLAGGWMASWTRKSLDFFFGDPIFASENGEKSQVTSRTLTLFCTSKIWPWPTQRSNFGVKICSLEGCVVQMKAELPGSLRQVVRGLRRWKEEVKVRQIAQKLRWVLLFNGTLDEGRYSEWQMRSNTRGKRRKHNITGFIPTHN